MKCRTSLNACLKVFREIKECAMDIRKHHLQQAVEQQIISEQQSDALWQLWQWRDRLSTKKGRPARWSKCAWVMKTCLMLVCMGKERSHTPVPASISVSLLSKKLVVRVLVSMPPEHPNTLICIPVWFFLKVKSSSFKGRQHVAGCLFCRGLNRQSAIAPRVKLY